MLMICLVNYYLRINLEKHIAEFTIKGIKMVCNFDILTSLSDIVNFLIT